MSDRDANDMAALDELRARLPPDIPIDPETIFPAARGLGVKAANQRRLQCLENIAPVLKAMFEPDERVRFVTLGTINFTWELLLMGWTAMLINRAIIVLTDRRILMIHTTTRNKPRSYVNQLRLDAVKKLTRSFIGGALVIHARKGSRMFSGVPRVDSKAFASMVAPNRSSSGAFEFLCGACFTPSASHVTTCGTCQTSFKSPRTATWRSLFLPGLGDWYLGHRLLAVIELIGAALVWVLVVALLMDGLDALPFALVILVMANGIDALLTYFQAKKGLMSEDGALPTGNLVVR